MQPDEIYRNGFTNVTKGETIKRKKNELPDIIWICIKARLRSLLSAIASICQAKIA